MADALDLMWDRACAVAASPGEAVSSMACYCLSMGLTEMTRQAREPDVGRVIAALGGDEGPATLVGLDAKASVVRAVTANAFAMHAGLADDAYLLAAHPGLAVIPAVLAAAEAEPGPVPCSTVTGAIVAGYEIAGVLSELLVPRSPQRGWRVASLIAPATAAAAAAFVAGVDRGRAVSGLRIATAAMGGPLEVVSRPGDGWRIQPALAAAAGIGAQRAAAAGLEGTAGVLEGDLGAFHAFCGSAWPGLPEDGAARITRVTFKRFGVAGYGQAIFDALKGADEVRWPVTAMVVRVPPFAAGYGSQRRSQVSTVANVAGIALAGLAAFHPAAEPPSADRVDIVVDDGLGELDAELRLTLADGSTVSLAGTGSTSHWNGAHVSDHCVDRLGEAARGLPDAVGAALADGSIEDIVTLWRGLMGGDHGIGA